MANRRTRSKSRIPFAVFAVLLIAIVGFHLQNQQRSDSVLGMTSGTPLFSKEWFAEILSFFGLGAKKETKTVEYLLPSYGANTSSGGFGTNGSSPSLMSDLQTASDDGGAGDFNQLQKDASGL